MAHLASSFTKGSVMEADFKIWKNDGATISSIQNYFPGKKGYQQLPWIAGTSDIPTLTVAAESSNVHEILQSSSHEQSTSLCETK